MTDPLLPIFSRELPLRRTPFARLFKDTGTPHHFDHEWNELPVCSRCGGFEGGLLATCPIQRMTTAEGEIAYETYGALMDRFRAELDARRAAGLDDGDYSWWGRKFVPTIEEYNEAARVYNDRLLDIALMNKGVPV